MSIIDNLNKDELKLVVEELRLTSPESSKIIDLRDIIEKSKHYSNEQLMKDVVNSVVEEYKSRNEAEKSKLELDKIKLPQLEKELGFAKVRRDTRENLTSLTEKSETGIVSNNLESFIKSIKTLTIPTRAESFNLFFQSLEKAFKTKNVPEEFKAEILLNILGEKANNLMIYLTEDDLISYDKLRTIVLKEFQPTARECLNNFRRAQKLPSENYLQLASRFNSIFLYYSSLREVNDFKSLWDLIVSDRIFNPLDRELMSHIAIKQAESYFKPQQLGR